MVHRSINNGVDNEIIEEIKDEFTIESNNNEDIRILLTFSKL